MEGWVWHWKTAQDMVSVALSDDDPEIGNAKYILEKIRDVFGALPMETRDEEGALLLPPDTYTSLEPRSSAS